MTRLEYLKTQIDYSKLLEHIKMRDFDEFVLNRYGDIVVYRVYGNNETNYRAYGR